MKDSNEKSADARKDVAGKPEQKVEEGLGRKAKASEQAAELEVEKVGNEETKDPPTEIRSNEGDAKQDQKERISTEKKDGLVPPAALKALDPISPEEQLKPKPKGKDGTAKAKGKAKAKAKARGKAAAMKRPSRAAPKRVNRKRKPEEVEGEEEEEEQDFEEDHETKDEESADQEDVGDQKEEQEDVEEVKGKTKKSERCKGKKSKEADKAKGSKGNDKKNAHGKKSAKDGKAKDGKAKDDKAKDDKSTKDKKAPTKRNGAKDKDDDAATLAKKQRLSRKSAAYHAAHKAAKDHGKTEEECKTLAKAATQRHPVPPQIV